MEVSVIIPVFNAERFLKQAVQSALDQPETAEIILVEDGSIDQSMAVCRRLASKNTKVRVLKHKDGGNRGAGASRNLGIVNARFDFVSFLDADDYYLPSRFFTTTEAFNSDPTVDGVYEATGTHFESDSARNAWYQSPFHRGSQLTTIKKRLPPEEVLHALILGDLGTFHTNGIAVKKSLFEKVGLFDESLLLHQDTVMWIKMAAKGRLVGGEIERPVAIRRVHENNRILWPQKGSNQYIIEMDRILIRWGREAGLSRKQMDLLRFRKWRNRLFNYDIWLMEKVQNGSGNLVTRELRKVVYLLTRLTTSPNLAFSPHLFRFIYHSLRRLSREIRIGRAG